MILNILFGSGFIGLFIATTLMLEANKRSANAWLGLFLLCVSWMMFNIFYFDYPEYLFGVFDWPIACLGPVLHCYVRELLGLGNGRRQAGHAILPGLFIFLLCVARLVATPGELLAFWQSAVYQNIGLGFQLVLLGYVVALAFKLRQHRRQVREHYSSILGRDHKWISTLLWAVGALIALWIPAFALHIDGLCKALVFAHFTTLNLLGWYALRHVGIFLSQPAEPAAPAPVPSPVLPPAADADGAADAEATVDAATVPELSQKKYVRSGMNVSYEQLIGERLASRAGKERDFLENDLTLADLAERIGTSPQLLSQYINDVLELNFFDYINGLRVEEVKRLICAPANADDALLDLAFRAGFNSKSTFNTAFKKITAMTPSVWRKLHVSMAETVS